MKRHSLYTALNDNGFFTDRLSHYQGKNNIDQVLSSTAIK